MSRRFALRPAALVVPLLFLALDQAPVAVAHWEETGAKPALYVEIWIQAIGRRMDGNDGFGDDDLEIAIEYTVTHGAHGTRRGGTGQIDYDWDAYQGIEHRKEVNILIYGHDECSPGDKATIDYDVREIDWGTNDQMGSAYGVEIQSGPSPPEGWGSGTGQLNVWFKRTETVLASSTACGVCVADDIPNPECECPTGFHREGDACVQCPPGRNWNGSQCVCIEPTEEWNGECREPCLDGFTRDSSGVCRPNQSGSSIRSASGPSSGAVAMYPPMESLVWDASDGNLIDTTWGNFYIVSQLTLAGVSDGPFLAQYQCVVQGGYAALYVGTFTANGDMSCAPTSIIAGHAPQIIAPVAAEVANGVGVLQGNVGPTGGQSTLACEGAWVPREGRNPLVEAIDELAVSWECTLIGIG